jgi:hypothetical protein
MKSYKVTKRFIVGAKVFAVGDEIELGTIAARAYLARGVVEAMPTVYQANGIRLFFVDDDGPTEFKPADNAPGNVGPMATKPDGPGEGEDPTKPHWFKRAWHALEIDNGRQIRSILAEIDDRPTSPRKAENRARLVEFVIQRNHHPG